MESFRKFKILNTFLKKIECYNEKMVLKFIQ
jgi:hypothetical protein